MKWPRAYLLLGALLIVAGIFLPQSWLNPLPQREILPPPPISGLWLLQGALILQGLVLIWLGFRNWHFHPVAPEFRLSLPAAPVEAGFSQLYIWLLVAVTLLGLGLRLISVNSDLWLDEITPILDYRSASAWQVWISYISSNNHLLNTLLVKLSTSLFSEQAWAIRLPAVIFGAATVPLLYWFARLALSRRASLSAALLLAVSYHHIFYSQDARAYTAYVFFSLLSSLLLVKGLQDDKGRIWVAYIAVMVLNFASILISGFVFAAHIVVGAIALYLVKRRGGSPLPLFWRLLMVLAITSFLGFQLYAVVLPQMYVYMRSIYADPSAGFAPFSIDFVLELARGLSAGFGTGLLFGAIPFLLIAGAGYLSLFRRNWALILAITLPGLLQATLLISRDLVFSPRFFILALPLAILVAVQGIDNFTFYVSRLAKKQSSLAAKSSVAIVVLLSVISLASLPPYYNTPKQNYRGALAYVEKARQSSDIVIVIHLAESGVRYYGDQFGVKEGQNYFYVRTVAALNEVLAKNPGKHTWLLLTFPRALRISLPELDTRIRQDWLIAQEYPATVGDGEITIWRDRLP